VSDQQEGGRTSAPPPVVAPERIGCVAIGRNEGDRLKRCLESFAGRVKRIVYVDSGSTDDSVAFATRIGALVVTLDMSKPFTAARARNAGLKALHAAEPDVDFAQFVDGDCSVAPGWLPSAASHLEANPRVAVVCGRRRELYPGDSVYNELCDIEWDAPVGPTRSCGGDAMMRIAAFEEVGGFNETLIAGEEPELCIRLRQRGWSIERLGLEMTAHDAAIRHFSQWWRRCVRAGHAYAEGAAMHGAPPERHYVSHLRRALVWGGCVPAAIAAGFVPTLGMSSLLASGYVVTAFRGYRLARERGRDLRSSTLYGVFCTVAKFPEFQGAVGYHRNQWLHRRSAIIEYK
jgi:GT2 family glycosyltransferase